MKNYKGSCHCGKVSFEVQAPEIIECVKCNCTICEKKQNIHFIVPKSKFKLLSGEDYLTTYTFCTHVAKHMFCRVCGVQSFYCPRSNPDGVGIMPHCLDGDTVKEVIVETTFDGLNWEEAIKHEQGEKIKKLSKE